jgi:glycosyltransferase involved in cell wall biosynthesis
MTASGLRIEYLSLHEHSGYAEAARRCMAALRAAGADVRWVPFVPGPGWRLGYEPAPDGEPSGGDPDVVVAHLVPEYWPRVRRLYRRARLVGHTVWETDRLPAHWPALLDEADLVVVPTAWNRDVLRRSGLRASVAVVPHAAAAPRRVASDAWSELGDETFVVYTIGPWTTRKALPDTVRAYQSAFAGRDDTELVVVTSPADFTEPGRRAERLVGPGTAAWALARTLAGFERPAPVRLVTRDLHDDEIDALHARGDCYLSLCRAEGWGIPAFDAAAFANPVVITGYGGQRAYLDEETAFLVRYRLVPVEDPAGGGSYTPDQRWAEPSIEHAAALLREAAADPAAASARGAAAAARVRREFAPTAVATAFLEALAEL